jgi:hypothetical protein
VSEQVIRHRGGGRDENGQLIPASDVPLEAFGVAPGGGSQNVARLREGETIAATVYFTDFPDLTNADELTVRGERYSIIVNDWHMSGQGGLEVLCTRGQG